MEHIEGAALERRVNELEKEYEARERADIQRIDELRFQLAGLIGKNNLQMLTEYTDRLIAQYNADVDWFYRKGLEDARREKAGGFRPCAEGETDDHRG